MKTSKSPKRVLVEALAVAEASLPRYSHRFSPRVFTQHQLFACLVLKDCYNLTYRGIVGLLACTEKGTGVIVWDDNLSRLRVERPLAAQLWSVQ